MGQHLVTHVTHPIFVTHLTHRPIPCSGVESGALNTPKTAQKLVVTQFAVSDQ